MNFTAHDFSVARFIKDEWGTTAIEYALIGAGISVAILATVQLVGANVSTLYDTVAGAVAGAQMLLVTQSKHRPQIAMGSSERLNRLQMHVR